MLRAAWWRIGLRRVCAWGMMSLLLNDFGEEL